MSIYFTWEIYFITLLHDIKIIVSFLNHDYGGSITMEIKIPDSACHTIYN